MFGRSKAVTFDPYRRRRARGRLPRWLVLLLIGVAIGAAGVVVVQVRYLPPRLSAEASAELRSAFDRADSERLRLSSELGAATRQLAAALADDKGLAADLAASRADAKRLQDDLASVVDSLPPDPRAGTVAVRAARFMAQGGIFSYDVVLTRERVGAGALSGLMQLVVAGVSAGRTETSVTSKPVALSIGRQQVVRGSLALPAGFSPRQTTIQVFDRPAGQVLGMRVLLVAH